MPSNADRRHGMGIAKCDDHPYLKVEHKCVDNREVTSAVSRGVLDYCPQLERIVPNFDSGNYLSKQVIEEVLMEFCNAENSDKNQWQNITGGNTITSRLT